MSSSGWPLGSSGLVGDGRSSDTDPSENISSNRAYCSLPHLCEEQHFSDFHGHQWSSSTATSPDARAAIAVPGGLVRGSKLVDGPSVSAPAGGGSRRAQAARLAMPARGGAPLMANGREGWRRGA